MNFAGVQTVGDVRFRADKSNFHLDHSGKAMPAEN
jgi:hypothetical protein